ncbi:hypothetical protein Pfo_026050 [Paulownia fortunei]|nr:hypothetical protein Pfo_026050 [Paulownia fortunei]
MGGNGRSKSKVKVVLTENGNGKLGVKNSVVDSIVYVDEVEMERKIEEIRVMAREAREKERLESKKNGLDSEDSNETDAGKYFKSGIEEEVDNRLIKLRKKLENVRDKMPLASVGYLRKHNKRKDGVEKGELDERVSNGALLFKKKYKFKGLSGDPMRKPKGFIDSDDTRVKSGSWEKGDELFKSVNGDNDAVGLGDGEKQTELSHIDPKGSDAVHVVEEDKKKGMSEMTESTQNTRKKVAKGRGTSKQGKGKGVAKSKAFALEKNNGRSALEAVQFRKLSAEATKSRKSSAQDIALVSNELSKGNDSLKGKAVGDAKSALESESETDFWWFNLPYVLVILMRRGHDGEGGEGLYTLKSISSAEDRISHMVAFEDRADATNFCYLLQSFFEDLEDFKADVVPLTVKELNEAVKSYTTRVIVVKRGQLQLYAGQPLTDAEMALHAMIEQG